MPAPRHTLPVVLALAGTMVAAALFSGCGDTVIDKQKTNDTVQVSLEGSLHERIKTVECPSDQSVDPGATFECEVVFPNGKRESAILKIRNKDADISIVGLEPMK